MNTLEKVNIAILLATITYIVAVNSLLSGTDRIGPGLRWFITFLTSVGHFRLLIILTYWVIRAGRRREQSPAWRFDLRGSAPWRGVAGRGQRTAAPSSRPIAPTGWLKISTA